MRDNRTLLYSLLLLLAAVALRVNGLDTTRIRGDQSFTLNTAMAWVNGGQMPLAANKSSVGFLNPPMIEYLYAPALWVWPDILSVSVLTLLGGLVAIGATAFAVERVFGRIPALTTTLLFIVNPWMIHYSRLIWNQTMLPPFAALSFACWLLYFCHKQRTRYLIGGILSAAVMTQVHPGSVMQVGTMGLIGLIFFRKLRWKPLLVGCLLFILSFAPYLWLQSGRNFEDIRAALGTAGEAAQASTAALLVSIDLLRTQGLWAEPAGTKSFDRLATALFALGLIWTVMHLFIAWQRRSEDGGYERAGAYLIVLLWWLVPLLYYTRSSVYLQTYYLMGQIPAQFVMVGLLFAGVYRQGVAVGAARGAILRTVSVVVLAVWIVWQSLFAVRFVEARRATVWMQVRHVREAVQVAQRLLDESPDCKLIVLAEGHQQETSQLALMLEFTEPERVLLADGNLSLPVPANCGIYLDAIPQSRASAWMRERATAVDSVQVLEGAWQFYQLDSTLINEMAFLSDYANGEAVWENGARLVAIEYGDEISAETQKTFTALWEVVTNPPPKRYHIGTYLLTPDNQVIGQSDGPGFDSAQWHPGDRFVTWFDIFVPADLPDVPIRPATAFYSWPEIERVNLTNGENTLFFDEFER